MDRTVIQPAERPGEAGYNSGVSLFPGLLRRIPLFWRLQLLGWGGFGLVSFYALSVYFELSDPSILVLYETVRMTMACALTLVLRPFYRRLWARSASFWAIGLASLAGSVFGGVGLLAGFKLTFMRLVNPLSRAGDVSTYPKTILDYSLIFLAWSALYFGIKHWQDLQREREEAREPHADPETTPWTPDDYVLLNTGQDTGFVKVKDIACIESEAPYSRVHARDGKKSLVPRPLKEWQQRLPETAFVRIHRSTIVHLDAVERIEKAANHTFRVFLRGFDRPVIMSRRYARRLKDRFQA